MNGVHSMNEQLGHVPAADALPSAQIVTAGALLRAAREASGLHVAALAVAIKVPVKKLEALEADRFELLPDAVFVRALASSVCRALKVDPGPVLEKLPRSSIPHLGSQQRGINEPFRTPGSGQRIAIPDFLTKPAVLAVLVLLIGVSVLALMPARHEVASTAESLSAPVTPALSTEVTKIGPMALTPAMTASAPISAVTGLAPGKSDATKNAADDVAVAVPVAEVILGFKARGVSWVEVTDAKGVVQIRKTLANGDTILASGTLPLAVVVGRADVIDVEVRGTAFPLNAIAKDNVARFEVK